MRDRDGFTLVEVIGAIVVVGILGVFMSAGIARIMEGYLFTRTNAGISLQGQVALERIIKELRSLDGVTTGNAADITYSYNRDGVQVAGRTLQWSGVNGDPLTLGGNPLTDDVNNFTLRYFNSYNDAGDNTWNGTETMIGVSLVLNGADNTTAVFTCRVRPRNI